MNDRRVRRCLGAAAAIAAVSLVAPFPAAANSQGTITNLGIVSAVAGTPLRFTIDATLADPSAGSYVSLAVEPPNTNCPATPQDLVYANGEDPVNNPFPIAGVGTTLSRPGDYLLCAWLSDPGNAALVWDQRSLAFTVTNGGTILLSFSPTPADYTPLRITATGTSDVAGALNATYKPAGAGASCAATPKADTGTFMLFSFGGSDGAGSIAPGQYSVFGDGIEIPTGTFLVCEWLLDGGDNVIATASQPLTVGPFHGTISLPAPFQLSSPKQAIVNVAFHLNAPRRLWMTVAANQSTCASSFSGSHGIDPFGYPGYEPIGTTLQAVPGAGVEIVALQPSGTDSISLRAFVTNFAGQLVPGHYHLCAWLANDDNGAQTDFGPVSTTLTVPGGHEGRPPIPTITGYSWKFNSAHVLRLIVWSGDKARIFVTLYRSSGGRRSFVARLAFKGHRGKNDFVIRRWHGIQLGSGRYTISLRTQVGNRRSRAQTFVFTL